jgi:diguanylate cyclase (GGDEF)-like protein
MSYHFKPPSAAESLTSWRDLVRAGPDNDPFWLKVRTTQLDFLSRYFLFTIAVGIGNASVVLAALADRAPLPVLVGWFTILVGMIAYFARREIRDAIRGEKPVVTRRFYFQVLAEILVVGIGWGVLFGSMLPRLSDPQLALVVGMTLVAIGTTAYSTAIFPLAAVVLSGPIAIGTAIGLLQSDWRYNELVFVILMAFVLVIVRGNALTTFAFLARLKTQDRLMQQEEVVRLLLKEFDANGNEWLFEFGADGRLTFATTRFGDAIRRPVEEVIGRFWLDFVSNPDSRETLKAVALQAQAFRDIIIQSEVEGEIRWWSLSGTPKFDPDGRLIGYRGVGSDVTEKHRSAERIAELANFDSLTGLVNRRIVHSAIADGLSGSGGVALLFVDLDRFKAVNDSLGHASGDRLLAQVANRLRTSVGAAGEIGRLGGDEFAVVLRTGDADVAHRLGEALIGELCRPFQLGGSEVRIGASIGLAIGPADGASVEALMRAADLALYDVKGKGRGTVRRYDREMHARAEARRALELDLRVALERDQIHMAYQPIVDALDERVVGFEALMRWRHPVHGDVPPSSFIPIAEDTGLIVALGRFALKEATQVAARWPRHIKISVNLSPLQFEDDALVDDVARALRRSGLSADRLELELTESVFLDQRRSTTDRLDALRALGCGFALDDFGTGYSSLGYLQKIAFNRIKIDRSFVRAAVEEGNESTAIIQAIVALADRLGMETTAEGTETRAEFEAMRRLGCAQIQGYYFGRPMSAEDASRHLQRSEPLIDFDHDALSDALTAVMVEADELLSSARSNGSLLRVDPEGDPASGETATMQSPAAVAPTMARDRRAPRRIRRG